MLSVKRWCYLSNRNKSSVVFVPSGRFSISSFLSIYPLYTDCSHFPKIFFSFFLALFQFEDYFFFFTRNVITHTKLTRIDRSIERIFGNKGEIFWKFFFFLITKFLKGNGKEGKGRFVSNDRWRAQIKVESSEREPSWKREPFSPSSLYMHNLHTRLAHARFVEIFHVALEF